MKKREVLVTAQVTSKITVFGRTDDELKEVAALTFGNSMHEATWKTEVHEINAYVLGDPDDRRDRIAGDQLPLF